MFGGRGGREGGRGRPIEGGRGGGRGRGVHQYSPEQLAMIARLTYMGFPNNHVTALLMATNWNEHEALNMMLDMDPVQLHAVNPEVDHGGGGDMGGRGATGGRMGGRVGGRAGGRGRDGGGRAAGDVHDGRGHPPQPQKPCNNAETCYSDHCPFAHTVERCESWSDCKKFDCKLRHGKTRPRLCIHAGRCTKQEDGSCPYLHPPLLCQYDAACINKECTKEHTVPLCGQWDTCEVYSCIDRHSKDRMKKCRYGIDCIHPHCTAGLHPPLCENQECLRFTCSKRHRVSPLHYLLLNTKAPCHNASVTKTLLQSASKIRLNHVEKMTQVRRRYRHIDQVISAKEGDMEEEKENMKLLEALKQEGFELQAQLDYFDKVFYQGIQQLLHLKEESHQSTAAAGATAVTYNVSVIKSIVTSKLQRELYRLQQALPALSKRQEIESLLSKEDSMFLVVKGETGSGKSTQLPQYCVEYLNSQRLFNKRVIVTQPRKVSATSLAERVAYEWSGGEEYQTPASLKYHVVGNTVGYRVGAQTKVSPKTRIEYCTEGVLLKSLMSIFDDQNAQQEGGENDPKKGVADPLEDVGVIIIDEAHERSITCDIILSILQKMTPSRWSKMKVIVTSATINTELFCHYFNQCPLIEIPGRMFPVDVLYEPIPNHTVGVTADPTVYIQACVNMAFTLHMKLKPTDGDILCFLTGQEEVEKAKYYLEKRLRHTKQQPCLTNIYVLYGKQHPEEQKLVFQKTYVNPNSRFPPKRKIVFATNVAETGVTIDGIRHVIDSGLIREARYDSERNMTVLEVDSICQSSAIQRKGRAGRTSPGTCYRLYKETDYQAMKTTQTPEILSRPVSLTLLNLISMGIRQPQSFNWLESPKDTAIASALNELQMLDCVWYGGDTNGSSASAAGEPHDPSRDGYHLTEFGKIVVGLQIDPTMAKLIYLAALQGKGRQGCLLAGLLSIASTFYLRGGSYTDKQAADKKHLSFASPKGDLVSMFNVFSKWKSVLLQSGATHTDNAGNSVHFGDDDDMFSESSDGVENEEDLIEIDVNEITEMLNNANPVGKRLEANNDEGDGHFDEEDRNQFAQEDELLADYPCDDDVMSVESDITNGTAGTAAPIIITAEDIQQMEEEEALLREMANHEISRQWCQENSINSKSLLMALSMANDLILEMNRLPEASCWHTMNQYGTFTNEEDIAQLFFHAYCMNTALNIQQSDVYSIMRYDDVHQPHNGQMTACLHPGSSLVRLNKAAHYTGAPSPPIPTGIVYHSMLSTSRSFMLCTTPVSEAWIAELCALSPYFRAMYEAKLATIPNEMIKVEHVSMTLASRLLARGGLLKKAFETEYDCSLYYDESTFMLEVWCNALKKETIERALASQLEKLRMIALNEKEESIVYGNVRAVYSSGYEVQRLLFADEYLTLCIAGIPSSKTIEEIEHFIVHSVRTPQDTHVVKIDSVDILHTDDRSKLPKDKPKGDTGEESMTVAVTFQTPEDAKLVKEQLDKVVWNDSMLTVTIGGNRPPPSQPMQSMSQLVMTWPLSRSAGEALLEFNAIVGANILLSHAQQFSRSFRERLGQNVWLRALGTSPNQMLTKAKMPIVVDNQFRASTDKDMKYRIRVNRLDPKVDEMVIKECVEGFIRDHAPNKKDRSFFPARLMIKRQEVDKDLDSNNNENTNIRLAALNSMIPMRDAMTSDPLAFFDSHYPGRAGFYLRYHSLEETQRAYQEWITTMAAINNNNNNNGFHGMFEFGLNHNDHKKGEMFGQPIRMEAQFITTLSIEDFLWQGLSKHILQVINELLEVYPQPQQLSIVEKETTKAPNLKTLSRKQFRIQSNQSHLMNQVTSQLQRLLKPNTYLPPSEEIRKIMFSNVVLGELTKLSEALKETTCIRWDKQRSLIYVYGDNDATRHNGVEAINKTLNDTLNTKLEKFQYTFKSIKKELEYSKQWAIKSKEVAMAQAIAWSQVSRIGGSSATKSKLDGYATVEGKPLLEDWLQANGWIVTNHTGDASTGVDTNNNSSNGSLDCPFCWGEMDLSQAYVLGCCEHSGCRSCLERQFAGANRKEFVNTPIRCTICPNTTTSYCMPLQDVRSLANAVGIETIKRCSVTKFVREHSDIVVRCPNSTKCDNLLDCRKCSRVDENDRRAQEQQGGTVVGYCDACDTQYCISCSDALGKEVKSHKGDSCEENRANGGTGSGKRQHANRLLELCTLKCPHCKSAFYDFSGCCAVTCHCNKYFCGLCLLACNDSGSCHSHVTSCPLNKQRGDYFNSDENIQAAHRLLRIRALKEAVKTIPPELKEAVFEVLEKDLLDFNIYIFDIR